MAKQRKATINWEAIVRSEMHPLKVKIIDLLASGGEYSPMMMHKELGDKLGNVSYHVRALLDAEMIELVRIEPRRGAVEHFYRATSKLRS